MFKTFLTAVIWSFIITLSIPTTLILASWNAVPGDSTYKLKVGLEQAMLGVAPSENIKNTLQIKYTERRFDEVEKVLGTSYASESLNNFNNQLITTKNSVQEMENIEEKSIQAQVLISTLEEVFQRIEEEKSVIQTDNTASKVLKPTLTPSPISTPYPTSIPVISIKVEKTNVPAKVVTSIPTKIPSPIPTSITTNLSKPVLSPDISHELDETQKIIKEVIIELKQSQNQENNRNTNKKNKQSRDNKINNARDSKSNNKDKSRK